MFLIEFISFRWSLQLSGGDAGKSFAGKFSNADTTDSLIAPGTKGSAQIAEFRRDWQRSLEKQDKIPF
jgi:hypothetical protein